MAKQTINIGSAYNDPDSDKRRDAFDKCNDNFTELYDSISYLGDARKQIVDIGNWNMDSTNQVTVNWALPTNYAVCSIKVTILPDTGNAAYPLDTYDNNIDHVAGYFIYNGTAFVLDRIATSFFDDAAFDSASINRGYIVVEYISTL